MEEETLASPEIPMVKIVEDMDSNVKPIKVRNGDVNRVKKEGKKVEEETALDEEFIEVEEESLDAKDGCDTTEIASVADDKPSVVERSSRNPSPSREKAKDLINELRQELGLKKASESQVKEDLFAIEILLSSTKEDLEAKMSELEEIKLKLKEEVSAKELVEVLLKNQEANVTMIQEELAKVTKEREVLEDNVADLTNNAAEMKEVCGDLEEKVKLYDDYFCIVDILLSQALANNADLELKLRSLEELHHESGYAVTTATQKNLELENALRASNAAAAEVKSQFREMETRFIAEEQRKVELEQQLNLVELIRNDAEREVREFSKKISALNSTLRDVDKEKKQLSVQVQENEHTITQLESELNHSSTRNWELELELNNVAVKCAEHKGRVNVTRQRSLELEDLIEKSHSKVQDTGKRVSELELLLEAEKCRIQNLEEQINTLEKKCGDAEEESKKHSEKVSELEAELAAFQSKASILVVALLMANDKEKELTKCLNVTTEDKRNLEDALENSTEKLIEAENRLDVLAQLASSESTTEGLKKKLMKAEDKAAHSFAENKLLIETNMQLKIKVNELQELLNVAHAEKDSTAQQLASHINTLTELTDQHSRASELQLTTEVRISEAETHLQEAIEKYTQRDSEAKDLSEKLNAHEGRIKLYEEQVNEAFALSDTRKIELEQILLKFKGLESFIEELQSKCDQFEKESEGLAEANLMFTEELATYQSRQNDLQTKLSAAFAEKDEAIKQLHSSKKETEDLKQKVTSEGLRLQSQKSNEDALKAEMESLKSEIAEKSLLENRLEELEEQLTEAEARVKEEIEIFRVGADGRVTELKSKIEDYEFRVHDRDMLNAKLQQLERELHLAQTAAITEQKEADAQKQLERDAALKHSLEELEDKNKAVLLLEKQVKKLEQKMQLADTKSKEKDAGRISAEFKDGTEVKSRDIRSTISTFEVKSPQISSYSDTSNPVTEASLEMALFKFILGVVLVSVIIGVILGKRY